MIAVTGVTGALGGRVARLLADRGIGARHVVRNVANAPAIARAGLARAAYGDFDAMRDALVGVTRLLLVSASESADRVREHLTAVAAAQEAGVARVVYTSFLGASPDATFTLARHHWQTEEAIRESGMAYTFLRDNLYLDVFAHFVGEDGVIRGPAGTGRVGAVARQDIADAAVAVLLEGELHDGRTYDLTGPAALTLAEVADELSRASGRQVRYHAETLDEAYASRAGYGAPDWEVEGWVTSYAAIGTGELDVVTDDIPALTGHPALSLAEHLAR